MRLEDEDGVDGPFERAMDRAMREERKAATMMADLAFELDLADFEHVAEITEGGASVTISFPVDGALQLAEIFTRARMATECAECGDEREEEPRWVCLGCRQ